MHRLKAGALDFLKSLFVQEVCRHACACVKACVRVCVCLYVCVSVCISLPQVLLINNGMMWHDIDPI